MTIDQKLLLEVREALRNRLDEYIRNMKFDSKQVLYVSMETMPGSTIANTLMNLPEDDPIWQKLQDLNINYEDLVLSDPEPALGNGGLGRLTACIAESCATGDVPLSVNTLRYRTGLFRQKFVNGEQVEVSDIWCDSSGNYFFEFPLPQAAQRVEFGNGNNKVSVEMIPCLIPQIGAGGRCVVTAACKVGEINAPYGVDPELYRRIDEQLYCEDQFTRLRQEYALSSFTVKSAIRSCLAKGHRIEDLPNDFCLHINDTHASLMIPELLRILLDEHLQGRYDAWDVAWDIATRTFVYTNHTIMAEALEKWPLWMIEQMLPYRIGQMIIEIDRRMMERLTRDNPQLTSKQIESMRVIQDGMVHMANMDIFTAYSVNGVAKIHTQILCQRELNAFWLAMPKKFCNVTNGVTLRKFLAFANPGLRELITKLLGSDTWIRDTTKLRELLDYADDSSVQASFLEIRHAEKEELAAFIKEQRGIDIPSDFIFDVQIKRIHMYKRQLLNCLHIIYLYNQILNDPDFDMVPTAFIFGGKAASSYRQAKDVIRLILRLEKIVNENPIVSRKMRVAFVENYNVSKAMLMIPATDVSEQISTASTEASGTGNMKLMLNGALTLGTLDGANVEIYEEVGDKGMFLFGLHADEVLSYQANGNYCSWDAYKKNPELKKAVDMLVDGSLGDNFSELYNELLYGEYGNAPDRFFVLKDFESYVKAHRHVRAFYKKPSEWAKQSIRNVALAGRFSSDRMVREYCEKVWKIPYGKV